MSLLAPTKKPINIYRSTDLGAPLLDKTAGCMTTILKACLVTGYGSKVGAGWTVTHEDAATKSKVFGVNANANALSLRMHNDTGVYLSVKLVKDVVDANTATTVLDCGYLFSYGNINTGSAWTLIATDKGFWFFTQAKAYGGKPHTRAGIFMFAGIVPGATNDAYVISYTGGPYGDDANYGITQRRGKNAVGAYNLATQVSAKGDFSYISDGMSNYSDLVVASPLCFVGVGDVYQLPIYSPSRNNLNNFEIVDSGAGSPRMMNFCTSTQQYDNGNNAYVLSEEWLY